MGRAAPVVEFPAQIEDPVTARPLHEVIDILRAALGRLTALLDVALLTENAGLGLTAAAGAGTALPASRLSLDSADAGLDQVRLIAHGVTSAGTATVQLYDVTNALVLATASLSTVLSTSPGFWETLPAFGGERVIEARVVGDGVANQTVYALHAQFRTLQYQP